MIVSNRPRIYDIDLYGVGLTIGICLIAYAALLKPLEARTLAKQQQQFDASKRLSVTQTQLAAMQTSFQQQNALALRLARMPDVMAESRGLDDVIGRIDVLSRQYGVSLDEVEPDAASSTEHHTMTPLKLKFSGRFRETMQLLNTITQNMPYVRIDNINIITAQKGAAVCDIGLELHVFSK